MFMAEQGLLCVCDSFCQTVPTSKSEKPGKITDVGLLALGDWSLGFGVSLGFGHLVIGISANL